MITMSLLPRRERITADVTRFGVKLSPLLWRERFHGRCVSHTLLQLSYICLQACEKLIDDVLVETRSTDEDRLAIKSTVDTDDYVRGTTRSMMLSWCSARFGRVGMWPLNWCKHRLKICVHCERSRELKFCFGEFHHLGLTMLIHHREDRTLSMVFLTLTRVFDQHRPARKSI